MAKQKYEESPEDIAEDKAGAKKLGMTMEEYENSPQDAAEDAEGQARIDEGKEGGFVLPHIKAKREGR